MVRAALALSGLYRSKDQGKSVVRSQKRLGSKKGSRGDAESADEEPEGKVTPEKEKQISEGRAAEVRSRFLPSDISLFVFFVPPPRSPRLRELISEPARKRIRAGFWRQTRTAESATLRPSKKKRATEVAL